MKKLKMALAMIVSLVLLGALAQRAVVDWQISPVPQELPQLEKGVWEAVLKMGLSSFYNNAISYNDISIPGEEIQPADLNKECTLVYGLLAPANYWHLVPGKYRNYESPSPELQKAIFQIMHSEELRQTAYQWLKPHYLRAFQMLDPKYQAIYIEILEHANAYLKNFDYQKELTHFKMLQEKCQKEELKRFEELRQACPDCDKPDYDCETTPGFTVFDPEGKTPHFRKLEAFIFRQVHYGRMQPWEMRKWAKTILNDLKAASQTNQPPKSI